MDWVPDVLPGFEQLTLDLLPDDEGPVVATLVRRAPASGIASFKPLPDNGVDVLYIHGWVDYFHQKHLANYFEKQGYRFYALDLRKYGRSIREWQTPGYTDSLSVYDEDINAALIAIGHAPAPGAPPATPQVNAPAEPLEAPATPSRYWHPTNPLLRIPIATTHISPPETSPLPIVTSVIRTIIDSARSGYNDAVATAVPASSNDEAPDTSAAAGSVTPAIPPTVLPDEADPEPPLANDHPDQLSVPLDLLGKPADSGEPASPSEGPRARQQRDPNGRKLVLMAHSTGGLIASLWAAYNPGRIDALILNSPWLEFQTGTVGRRALEGPIRAHARLAPKSHLFNPDPGFYTKSISNQYEGEWDINPDWKPLVMWPPTAAWMSAIFRGQDRLAMGLDLDVPVLVMLSAKSTWPVRWTPELFASDQVITVDDVMTRAPSLSRHVTIVRFEGALHDVVLSTPEVRSEVWAELTRWLNAYVT